MGSRHNSTVSDVPNDLKDELWRVLVAIVGILLKGLINKLFGGGPTEPPQETNSNAERR